MTRGSASGADEICSTTTSTTQSSPAQHEFTEVLQVSVEASIVSTLSFPKKFFICFKFISNNNRKQIAADYPKKTFFLIGIIRGIAVKITSPFLVFVLKK